ncbi:unnamed protein product [Mytilus edulis]|uniref:DDE Tnp4 domain-containing protein n=1 Tax=Mytilus edulis TaxID=6550 RepID=A0A8S3UCR7_MYTED|nr:unnamed protein product [Mytilus edulis]
MLKERTLLARIDITGEHVCHVGVNALQNRPDIKPLFTVNLEKDKPIVSYQELSIPVFSYKLVSARLREVGNVLLKRDVRRDIAVGPRIAKQNTFYRNPLEPGLKLAITLRHLASGAKYRSMQYGWRVPHNTISVFIPEVPDIGGRGAASDAQLWNASDLKSAIEDGDLDLPDAEPLPHDTEDIPYFYIGDDAFGLRTFMQKPYGHRALALEERIFNYRLSRGT